MPIGIIKLIGFLLIILLLEQPFIAFAQDQSLETGRGWYTQHKETLLSLNKLLLKHSAIKRVDPALRLKFVPKYAEFDAKTLKVYEDILEICANINIENVVIARVKGNLSGEIIEIRYLINSYGYVSSRGGFLGISFVPNRKFSKYLNREGAEVEHLDSSGWYLVSFTDV